VKLDDGWVPLTTMTKFKRLAELTTSHEAILQALKKSTAGLLEINEEGEKIRRSKDKPLPEDSEEQKQQLKARTVYCKGFPRQTTTIDKILEFFNGFEAAENVKV
jgi:lupus La protein